VDLLKQQQTEAELKEEPSEEPSEQSALVSAEGKQVKSVDTVSGVVLLIQATRVPARHKKMLRAKVTGLEDSSLALFEPDNHSLGMKGLPMAEAAMETDADNCVTLIMQNDALEPTRLKKGQVLGRVYPASLLTNEDQNSHDKGQEVFLPSLKQLSSAPQNQEGESQYVMEASGKTQEFRNSARNSARNSGSFTICRNDVFLQSY